MPKPDDAALQAAIQAVGINVPYYRVEVEGDSFRFYLYGGRTVTVPTLPGRGTEGPARAAPQRARPVLRVTEGPAVKITGSLDTTPVVESATALETMTKAELVALATKLGINPRSKATKAEIIAQIKELT